jgi:hypothetical protein
VYAQGAGVVCVWIVWIIWFLGIYLSAARTVVTVVIDVFWFSLGLLLLYV